MFFFSEINILSTLIVVIKYSRLKIIILKATFILINSLGSYFLTQVKVFVEKKFFFYFLLNHSGIVEKYFVSHKRISIVLKPFPDTFLADLYPLGLFLFSDCWMRGY
jgi:hypothetical protein